MLTNLKLLYKAGNVERLKTLRYDLGSVVHSLLTQELFARAPEIFEIAHESGSELKPFALSWPRVDFDNGFISWEISALNEQSSAFLELLAQEPASEYFLERAEEKIALQSVKVESSLTYNEFTAKYFAGTVPAPKEIELSFTGPCTFSWSSNGHYYPLPDIALILKSSFRKWRYFNKNSVLDEADTLDKLIKCIRYNHLKIFGQTVKIGGARVPCFNGSAKFALFGAEPIRRLLHLTLRYLEYCGVGAKAQMGLGRVKVVEASRDG